MRKVALLFALAAGLVVAVQAQDDTAIKQERAKLVGKWKPTSVLKGGKPAPNEKLEATTFHFSEDKITIDEGNRKQVAGYKIDPTKKPKTIDIIPEGPDGKKEMILGIYSLEGDALKISFDSKSRPKEFASPEGSEQGLVTFQRIKAGK